MDVLLDVPIQLFLTEPHRVMDVHSQIHHLIDSLHRDLHRKVDIRNVGKSNKNTSKITSKITSNATFTFTSIITSNTYKSNTPSSMHCNAIAWFALLLHSNP